ncbi:MAG: GMC family oxidoreductase [Pseudomonadota bacterium]
MSADLTADVAIVGAGVAGALTAAKLAEQGVDTLVVDAGPRITRETALETYRASPERLLPGATYPNARHAPHPLLREPDFYLVQEGPDPFAVSYQRIVGGTTWHWEATCLRMTPSDLRLKSETGLGADWPLSYQELAPWYDEAERELGVAGDGKADLGAPRTGAYPMPGMALSYMDQQFAKALAGSSYRLVTTPAARNSVAYGGRVSCCGANSCVPICPSGAKYDAMIHVEAAERAGARVFADRVVHRVELDPERRVAGLAFKRPDGSEGAIAAKLYVLAAHAIETPKILLMSRGERAPKGVANGSGLVGRNLMDHPYKMSWALAEQPQWPYRGPMTLSSIENTRWGDWRSERPGYRIAIYNNGWAIPTGAPIATVEALIDQGLEGEALARAIGDQLSRQVMIGAMTEQLPDPENRIEADFERPDALGIPRPKITFRFDDYTHRGMAAAERAHEEILGRLGTDQPRHTPEPAAGNHIMGTTRMGDDPKTSVVDRSLRAHEHPNLFLLGSGAFPTGGTANPTLTIAALSLRAVAPILAQLAD